MRRIRVAHVVEAFGGGVFSSISQICNNLPSEDFEIAVFHSVRPETPAGYREFFREGVRLEHVPMVREVSPLADMRALVALFGALKRFSPDAVHLHSSKAGVLGRIACRLLGIGNVLYSPRGFSFLREDVSALRRKMFYAFEKVSAFMGGTIVACSNDEFRLAGSLNRRAVLVPNAVDMEIIGSVVPARAAGSGDPVVVGTSGRISSQKDPYLFESVASAFLSDPDVRFLWIGDGELREVLEGSSARIEVSGWKSRKEALSLVAGLDVFVLTSRWEGMPVSVLEAMALGKPVVATDIVGNRDLVRHGETGFLVGDDGVFENHIRELVRNRDMRERFGRKAEEIIREGHDARTVAGRFGELYSRGMQG